jgi:hypothetical protein
VTGPITASQSWADDEVGVDFVDEVAIRCTVIPVATNAQQDSSSRLVYGAHRSGARKLVT